MAAKIKRFRMPRGLFRGESSLIKRPANIEQGSGQKLERPLAALGFSFFLSLILASFLDLKMIVVLAALCLFALLAGLCIRTIRQRRRMITVLFAAMTAFSMYAAQEWLTYRPLQQWDGKEAHLRMETLDWVTESSYGSYVTVPVVDGDLPKYTRMTLWISGNDFCPTPYDIMEGDFTLSTPSDSKDGQVRGYSKSQKLYLNAQSASYREAGITLTEPTSRPWMYQLCRMRRFVRVTILSQSGMSDVSGLMSGVAFGYKDDIPADITYDFRVIGVAHLLAVSGMQTALLAQALLALLLFLRVPRRLASLFSAGGVLFFMALTGFTPSVMRAGIMSILFLMGLLFGREPDSLNSLGLSVLVITLVNPYAVNDVGLLLSFAATFGLLVFYPSIRRVTVDRLQQREDLLPWLVRPVRALAITIAATVPTMPIILLYFGQISLISPLSNLLMVFPATMVTVATCAGVLLSVFPPLDFLGTPFFMVGKWGARYLVWIADKLASIPFASVWMDQLFLKVGILAAMVFVFLGWKWRGRHGLRVTALWSVIALLCGMLTYTLAMHDVTKISVLQAGDATAVLLERDGRIGLVLMGDNGAVTTASRVLSQRNIRRLDFLMLPDLDAECAFSSMVLTENIGVDCLVSSRSGTYIDTVEALPVQGSRLYLDDGVIQFWNDCFVVRIQENWLRLCIGDTRLLLCPSDGDASGLTTDERLTNLVVYTAVPPLHVTAITAEEGVLGCEKTSLPYVVKTISEDLYPVEYTANGEVLLLTRGKGDLTLKE